MTPVRVVFQTNSEGDQEILQAATKLARGLPGCLQAEDFRSVEFAENLLHIELWESTAAWDAAWEALRGAPEGRALIAKYQASQAPFHGGAPAAPRRTGQNGLEFYKQARFAPVSGAWVASDEGVRANSIRWPAWGIVRIVIQSASDPAIVTPASQIANSIETRLEKGCLHFEFFRGVEFSENVVLIESWASAEIYDVHWMGRLVQQRASGPVARPTPPERRYGQTSFEWYSQCYYALTDDVWMPEDPQQRMSSVYW